MTTPQHAAHGFIMGMLLSHNNWVIGTIGLITGALPDVIGFFGKFKIEHSGKYPHITYNNDDWHLYDKAHILDWRHWWTFWPPYLLHLLIDKTWHRPEGGWYRWGVAAEIFGWIFITGPLLFYIFR